MINKIVVICHSGSTIRLVAAEKFRYKEAGILVQERPQSKQAASISCKN